MRPGRGRGTSRQYHRPGEGAARQLLLSPGRRWRSAASPEAGPVPACARDRDARARARRPAVDPPRRGAARAHPGLGAPGALPRPGRPQAGRGAPRQGGARARSPPRRGCSAAARSSPTRTCRWNLTAIPAAIRLVRKHEIDVVITTSPPNSIHLVGAAVKRATGARWVADLRDSVVAHAHRRSESRAVRAKEKVDVGVAQARRALGRRRRLRLGLHRRRGAHARAARPRRSRSRTAPTSTTSTGSPTRPAPRMRITHAGSFFGKRDPRPFLQALARLGARHRRALPRRLPQRRPRVGGGRSASATGSS